MINMLPEKSLGPTIHVHIHLCQEVQVFKGYVIILVILNVIPGDGDGELLDLGTNVVDQVKVYTGGRGVPVLGDNVHGTLPIETLCDMSLLDVVNRTEHR